MKLRRNLLWNFTNFYSFLTKDVPPFSPSHLEYRCLEKLQPFCNQEKKAKNLHNPTLILLSFWTYASSFVLFVLFRHLVVLTLWDPLDRSMPAFPVLHYLLEFVKLTSIESVVPSNNLILCCPLLFLPSICPRTRVLSNELALHIRWPNLLAIWFFVT